jgi:hypothetical protein
MFDMVDTGKSKKEDKNKDLFDLNKNYSDINIPQAKKQHNKSKDDKKSNRKEGSKKKDMFNEKPY